jgi:phosphatidylglycerol:prolipoprotein diacylglycerol transferase
MALALTVQSLLFATTDLHAGHVLAASLLSLLAGAAGAKLWFLVLERRARDRNGWCMQGLIAGVAVVAPPLLWLLDIPVGAFFDTAAPGLMFGLAIGRIGCFFTGCCTGRPSGSRWAIWASDRHLGARRLPTQLLECALALAVGVVTLVVFLRIGPHHGNLFIGAVAGYTLIRQALLRLRDERRRTRHGLRLVGVTASIVLALDLALFALI